MLVNGISKVALGSGEYVKHDVVYNRRMYSRTMLGNEIPTACKINQIKQYKGKAVSCIMK